MREILFRGKRVDNGEWVYGYYLYSEKYNKHYIVDERITTTLEGKLVPQESGFIKNEVIPDTVGQYTEQTDKNGKKIFEGDEIKLEYHGEDEDTRPIKIGIMNFNENQWRVNAKHLDGFTMRMYSMEVIGNIFDKEGNDE